MFSGSSNWLIGSSIVHHYHWSRARSEYRHDNHDDRAGIGLDILLENSAPGAFHDSGERFNPPKCHPSTRTKILTKIMDWVIGEVGLDGFFKWLYGPAGAGKSAIAQAIAEMCHARQLLLASFFFSRTDPKRNNEKRLIASIAYQIAMNAPLMRDAIEAAVNSDPAIFQRSIETQLTTLIIDPLTQLSKTGTFQSTLVPNLIIIDGLDKCNNHRVQQQILHTISSAVQRRDVPLKFLICSRAEPHLTLEFTSLAWEGMATRLSLDDGYEQDADIERYLKDSFHKIATTHPLKAYIPSPWPSDDVISTLVRKSSGQFIFAATVVKYISFNRDLPTRRLEHILDIQPSRNGPFAELDALYMGILSFVEDVKAALRFLGVLIVSDLCPKTPKVVGEFMFLDPDEVERLMLDLASVIEYLGMDTETRILHASFPDFLLDRSRSGEYYIDHSMMHAEIAELCLSHVERTKSEGYHEQDADSERCIMDSVHKMVTTYPLSLYFQTRSFHSTVLPNLHVSVYYALTTFETAICPWTHPSEWLEANTKHICAIFDGIVKCTENEALKLPETKVFQRLIVYIFAYNMVCWSNNTLSGELNVILKKYRDRDILDLIRSQANIKNELWTLFQNASREHREKKHDDLFKKLLTLDSISLSANIEVLIADQDTYEDVVETTGAGAQSLVNILHARLDFPMLPEHKRLLVGALTRLSERSGVYPDSLTLTNVTPERGRRAAGGFADVYKGRCLGEDIALKVFKIPLPWGVNSLNSWRSSDARFQNLIHEVITWRQLSHPNVLPFYGVHFLEEPLEVRFCLVSPWMEHGNIVEFLVRRHRDGPYTDTTDCVSLALDVANGVKYLHGEGVIHRDLKGHNILISPSMRAYIADFGLATFTDSGCATTLAGSAIMGTPKWLAPELIPHEEAKRHHTYASDIYAFALVCYEMFSGKLPFEDVQIYDLKPLLQRGERPSLPADELSRRRGLSSEMEGVIRDCWAQEPTERPSADNVVERLQLLRKHQDDERPLDKIGTSFFTQLLRDQADNPFAILSKEYHGASHSSQVPP